jgi:hypothetical protein
MSARDWKELPNRYMLREQDRHGGIPAVEEMPEPLPLVDISRLPAADEAAKLRVALENWGLFMVTTELLDHEVAPLIVVMFQFT